MRALAIACSLLLVIAAGAVSGISDRQVISRGRQIHADKLDSELPRKPFGAWFQELIGRRATIQWQVNDCGEQSGDPETDAGRDLPICAEVTALFEDGREVMVAIAVATREKGIVEDPGVYYILIQRGEETLDVPRLSELPARLGLQAPAADSRKGKKKR